MSIGGAIEFEKSSGSGDVRSAMFRATMPQNDFPAPSPVTGLVYTTRAVNELTSFNSSFCTLASNQITFTEDGVYCFNVQAYMRQTGTARLRVRNTTTGTTLLESNNLYDLDRANIVIMGVCEVSENDVIEIQHYVNTGGANAFGTPVNMPGEIEVYCSGSIIKVS
jgi:hypothetical protein